MRARRALINVLVHQLIIRQVFNAFLRLFVQKLDCLESVPEHGLSSFPFVLQNVKGLNTHRLVVVSSICVQSERDIGVSLNTFKNDQKPKLFMKTCVRLRQICCEGPIFSEAIRLRNGQCSASFYCTLMSGLVDLSKKPESGSEKILKAAKFEKTISIHFI